VRIWGVVLGALVLLAASTARASAVPQTKITAVRDASATPFSAVVTWKTNVPTVGRVQYGTAAGLGLWTAPDAKPTVSHQATLTGLSPATSYGYLISSAVPGGAVATVAGSVTSARLGAPLVTGTARGAIALDGQPFFPRMIGWQCPDTVDRALAAGANVFVGSCPGASNADVQAGLAGRALVVPDLPVSPIANPATVLGWGFADEPDNHGVSPAALAAAGAGTPGLTFLTLTSGFWAGSGETTRSLPESTYAAYANAADVVGFDLYPLDHCRPDQFTGIFDAQRQLGRVAPGKPTFQWIETGPIRAEYCGGWTMSPAQLTAEVWAAVAGGADGVGFFTATQTPVATAFGVDPRVEHAMATADAELGALAPALLTPPLPVAVDAGGRILASARAFHGALYVVAVNPTPAPLRVQVTAPGLGGRPLRRFEDGVTIPSAGASFADTLGPFAAHVYVAGPAG
jgi:hypothetical protein